MLRTLVGPLFFALTFTAIPAWSQTTSNTPVPPQRSGQHYPLRRAHVTAEIVSRVSPADRKLLNQAWLLAVRQKLLMSWRPLLPEAARPPMGQAGTAAFIVELQPKGTATGVRLERSTGNQSMLKAAEGAVKSANPYPPFPTGVVARRIRLRLIFRYD